MNTTSVQSPVANNNVTGNNNLTTVAKAVGVTTVQQVTAMTSRIAQLSAEAQDFETGAYANANQALYGLIQKAYALYKELTNAADAGLRFKKQGLADYLDTNGLGKYSDKPLAQRIIAAVFGDRDRRRVSSYNVTLRALIAENVKVEDVAATIQDKGGVQEMSVARAAGAIGVKEKAALVKEAVKSTTLGSVDTPETQKFANNEKVGDQFTAVLTQEADGSFSINTILDNTAVLNAALAAHYNIEKAKAKKG
jgi:hypothetical protein